MTTLVPVWEGLRVLQERSAAGEAACEGLAAEVRGVFQRCLEAEAAHVALGLRGDDEGFDRCQRALSGARQELATWVDGVLEGGVEGRVCDELSKIALMARCAPLTGASDLEQIRSQRAVRVAV